MSNDDHWESVLEGYGVEPETVLEKIKKLEAEIDRLNKVLKLTPDEILAALFCHGLSTREDEIVDDFDRKLLETAGKCIDRIINQKEAEK